MIDPPVHALNGLYTASVTNSFGLNDYVLSTPHVPPNSNAGSAPSPVAPAVLSSAHRRPPTPRCSSALFESTLDFRAKSHLHVALLNALVNRVRQRLSVILRVTRPV